MLEFFFVRGLFTGCYNVKRTLEPIKTSRLVLLETISLPDIGQTG
jgi:hypothetical protein